MMKLLRFFSDLENFDDDDDDEEEDENLEKRIAVFAADLGVATR